MNWITTNLERLEEEYDADHDMIPGAPVVTWADKTLVDCVAALADMVRSKAELIASLEKQVDRLEQRIERLDERVEAYQARNLMG